jgi:hypothetical protein
VAEVVIVRDLRGVPLWVVREYLAALGGAPGEADGLTGPGWAARLAQREDVAVGALRVGEVRLTLRGTPEAVAGVERALALRLVRAGG